MRSRRTNAEVVSPRGDQASSCATEDATIMRDPLAARKRRHVPNRPAARREPVSEPRRAGAGQRACSQPLLPRRRPGSDECWMRAMSVPVAWRLPRPCWSPPRADRIPARLPAGTGRRPMSRGSPTPLRSPVSTSCTSTGCTVATTSRRSWDPASRCSTTTTTATSTSTWCRAERSERNHSGRRPPKGLPLADRLYRNDLAVHARGERTLRFTDVTDESGVRARGYGMGVATGDIDNDGWGDLYLTRFGANQMFRNRGDGTFVEVSAGGRSVMGRVRGVRRRRSRRVARPVRRELPVLQPRHARAVRASVGPARDLLRTRDLSRPAEPVLPQPRRRHVPRRHRGGRNGARVRAGARRRDRRRRRRRLDRHLRGQRPAGEPALDEPA